VEQGQRSDWRYPRVTHRFGAQPLVSSLHYTSTIGHLTCNFYYVYRSNHLDLHICSEIAPRLTSMHCMTCRYLAAFNNVQGTVRGAPPPAATTTVGEVYPAVSATPTKAVQLPVGAVTWLPPPLPQVVLDPTTPSGRATMVFDRTQKQQVRCCYRPSHGLLHFV
jgi:hypothetical protein